MKVYVTDQNFIFKGVEDATLDPKESEIQEKDVWTGPFPHASFTEPPEHKETECALLVGDKWEIRQRVAGTYWHKETQEKVEIQDPFDDIDDYVNIEPPEVREGDSIEFKDGWVLKMGAESLAAFREHHCERVKKDCEKKILEKYSRDNQRNIDREALPLIGLALYGNGLSKDEQALIDGHKQMRDHINGCLAKCEEMKTKITSASQKELEGMK